MAQRGVLLSFEGGEGSGKTTQARRLAEHLKGLGYAVTLTREPGGTPLGERIREVLLGRNDELSPLEEFLLFSTARAQLVRTVIRPALEAASVVVVDRYYHSSYAYQGGGGALSMDYLRSVTAGVVGDCVPELVLLLDIEPDTGLSRCSRAGAKDGTASDRFEGRGVEFHKRVREAFLSCAQAEPERFVVVDASDGIEDVFARVRDAALEVLRARGLQPLAK
ncbi:dTMP kinase [bacterium]|nr:dTMP kinase [bacterium]